MAALPLVLVPHPFGDQPREVVESYAQGAAEAIVRALTTPVDRLQAEESSRTFPEPRSVARSKPIFALEHPRRGLGGSR